MPLKCTRKRGINNGEQKEQLFRQFSQVHREKRKENQHET